MKAQPLHYNGQQERTLLTGLAVQGSAKAAAEEHLLPSFCYEKHLAGTVCIYAPKNTQVEVYMGIT